ncbi:MAG TPA: hypothetical protein GX401_08845 [Clostridiales bacterium]|nr:hypothetical protein [Clostridiales bacterium]
MYNITFPKLDLLQNGNFYTGSAGTEQLTGCTNKTTFVYKIVIKRHDDSSCLSVGYYLQHPWNAPVINEEPIYKEFELSQNGLDDAKDWITQRCNSLLPNDK